MFLFAPTLVSLLSSLFLSTFFAVVVVANDSAKCTAFSINGSTPTSFHYHRFYDFRNIRETSVIPNDSSGISPLNQSLSVADASWTSDWKIQEQMKAAPNDNTIPLHYTTNNVYISNSTDSSSDYTTYLTLNTTRLPSSQLGAEISFFQENVLYTSLRVLTRVSGAPGAVAGIFTYYNDTAESDIEILTRDPDSFAHYSNQPTANDSGTTIPGSTFNVSMSGKRNWTEWNIYRLDWLPGQSDWYVNGKLMASTETNVAETGSKVFLSMWSNGGGWSGSMAEGMGAVLQVQWIEIVYNTSSQPSIPSSSDAVDCSVDKVIGAPMQSLGNLARDVPGFLMLLLVVMVI